MRKTHVRPSETLSSDYDEVISLVKAHDQVILTRDGQYDSVLIGLDDYAEYEKYLHSRYIAEELAKAEAEAADTNTVPIPHEKVWAEIREKYGF